MNTKLLLGCALLLLAGCEPSALGPLVVDGPELHVSLVTRRLDDAAKGQLAPVLRDKRTAALSTEFTPGREVLIDLVEISPTRNWTGIGTPERSSITTWRAMPSLNVSTRRRSSASRARSVMSVSSSGTKPLPGIRARRFLCFASTPRGNRGVIWTRRRVTTARTE